MKVEGYFQVIKNANRAVEDLKASGFQECFSDMNDHYVLDAYPGSNLAGTDSGSSQAGLVLNSGEPLDNPDFGPMASASPMVSGMGGFEEIADVNCRVVVNIDENNIEKVKKIISKYGGELRDPNFRMPDRMNDIKSDEIIERMVDDLKRSQ